MKVINSMNELGSFSIQHRDLCVTSSTASAHYVVDDTFLIALYEFTTDFFMSAFMEPSQFNPEGEVGGFFENFWLEDVHVGAYRLTMGVQDHMVYYKASKPDQGRAVENNPFFGGMIEEFQNAFNLKVCEMLSDTHEDNYKTVHKVDFI